jgi:hypothetical protein
MSKQFAKLKIYELGGGVAFQTETGTIPFITIPKGQATMKPWGPSGFVFEKVVTGEVIAFVDTFDDLLDDAGVAWGASQAAVYTAVGGFFFELGGGGGVAVYQQSLFTSFQRSAKTLTTLGIGSNSSTAVGFVVDEKVRILNSSIEITSFIAGIGTFSIHKVENGLVTERLFTTGSYSIAANGVYTFVTNLDLEPGIYAYIVQQTVIQTYRAFALPDNVFGVQSTMGTTTFINTKTSIQVGIPDPFPVGQANGTGNAPLAIFEIQMI